MRKPLALLVASTALAAATGLPGWSAGASPAGPGGASALTTPGAATGAEILLLAGGDDDDDGLFRPASLHHGDDDDDDDDHDGDDDCHDDGDDCGGRMPGPAPAGTVVPPANGLFGNGAPPQVKAAK